MRKRNKNIRLIDAPLYHYWQAIYCSFYSSRLYIDVVKRWRGYGFLYLLMMISLVTIPASIRLIYDFDRYFNEEILQPVSMFPLLYVQNGDVVFDKPMPYFIKNKKGEVIDIIDTTGKVTNITSKYPKLVFLMTKNKLYSRLPKLNVFLNTTDISSEDEVHVSKFDKSMNEVFNAEQWTKSTRTQRAKWFVEVLIYPILVFAIYGLYLVIMPLFGYVAIIFAQVVIKHKLKFKEGLRLFIVTSTPQMFLFGVLFTSGLSFNGSGILQIICMAIYFNCAVLCLKNDSKKMVHV